MKPNGYNIHIGGKGGDTFTYSGRKKKKKKTHKFCIRCNKYFFGKIHARYCSDKCAKIKDKYLKEKIKNTVINLWKNDEYRYKVIIGMKKRPAPWNKKEHLPKVYIRKPRAPEAASHLNILNYTCGNCGRTMNKGNYNRWHKDDKCKNIKPRLKNA